MKLNELLQYDRIVIQMHNDPDADTIASGFGLYLYFQAHAKSVRLIYGGKREMHKSNVIQMVRLLEIPVEYVRELPEEPELLITVDCRYGERNVQKFHAKHIAVIDHHPGAKQIPGVEMYDIRIYGACTTIIWEMLEEAGFAVSSSERLSTALYYGLNMDTGGMQEIAHPKDKDMRDELEFRLNQTVLTLLLNCNLSSKELKIAGRAMTKVDYQEENRFAIAEAQRCDPNILGIISDALIEVDMVDVCVVFCVLDDGIKLSVRSCGRETIANDFISFIVAGLGNGGGHERKAGGLINQDLMKEAYHSRYGALEKNVSRMAHRLLSDRAAEYYNTQDLIYTQTDQVPDLSGEPLYEKRRLPVGYVKATDMYPAGTKVCVRMLEGDNIYTVTEDTYFIIGIEGEVYTNEAGYFLAHNDPTDKPYEIRGEYAPTIRIAVKTLEQTEEEQAPKTLQDYVKECIPKEGGLIHARRLTRRTKVISPKRSNYLLGEPGDYLASRVEDPKRQYIIQKDIMERSYRPISE